MTTHDADQARHQSPAYEAWREPGRYDVLVVEQRTQPKQPLKGYTAPAGGRRAEAAIATDVHTTIARLGL